MMKIQDTVRAVVDKARFEKVVEMMRDARMPRLRPRTIPAMVESRRQATASARQKARVFSTT